MDKLDVCRDRLISYEKSGLDREFIRYNDHQISVSPKAAVLVPLFIKNCEIHILLTRRSHNVGSHKGQISFVGGRVDKQDSDTTETALREAYEEVGLDRKYVEVISTWKPNWVGGKIVNSERQLLLVYPVIAVLKPGFSVHINSSEVSQVFDVPLGIFLSSKHHKHGKFVYDDIKVYYHIFLYNGLHLGNLEQSEQRDSYVIWGFTGTICMRTAVVVYGRLPCFKLIDKQEKKGLGGYINYINDSSVCKKSKL